MMPHDVTQADCAAVDQWVREWKDCAGWHPALLQAFAARSKAAAAEERARVVAYLRTRLIANVGDRFAASIERGDHIQEK